MLGYVVAQKWSNERTSYKEGARQGRLGPKASEVGLIPLVVAIDELGASSSFCEQKKKSAASRFALLKIPCIPSGVILVVASRLLR